jgi:serine/threonine-protein kinase
MPSDSHSRSPSSSASSSNCTSCGEPLTSNHACKNPFQNLIGTTLDGRYQVKKILGQGGMGVVFQATQTSMNRDLAVKMLHPSLSSTPQFADRFRREAEVVSRLKHPNIISIYDFGQAQGAFYYTMELLEGENLKSIVKRDGPMSVSRAVNLIEQIGDALAYAHGEGILHRDMKPHNVMCARIHGRDHVKVLDFGLVKMVDEEGNEEHLTTTGQILGTPAYMSPEQAGGDPLDARSDLYSLGVVLYYLLAGSTPYKANSANKLLQLAMTTELPAVATRRQGAPIPSELEIFFRRALAFDKENRPENVDAFLAELRATLQGVSQAVLDAVPTGAVAPQPESRTLATGAKKRGTQSGMLPGMMTGAPPPPSASKPLLIGGGVGLLVLAGLGGAYFALRSPAPTPVAQTVPAAPIPAPKVDPAPAAPALPANVKVHVESEPAGAQLYDGEALLGSTPADLVLPRSRGAANLIFKLAGYLPQTQGVDLAGAGAEAVQLHLKLTADPTAQAAKPDDRAKPHGGKKPGKVDVPIFE